MYFVSITRLRVRSWRYMPSFFLEAYRSAKQAKAAEGNLRVSLLREAGNVFWTLTVWTSEQAMKSFMLAGAHRKAMPRLLEWCDEAALAHWPQESEQPPTWEEAHKRLLEFGRPSKVNHPNEAHRNHKYPVPKTTGAVRFK
jgi:heme-degrading monooxygenase HmoA